MNQLTTGMAARFRRPRVILVMNIVLAVSGAVAVAALVLEYGFRHHPVQPGILHIVEMLVVAVFVLDRVGRLVLARNTADYLRDNWVDFALIALAAIAVAVSYQLYGEVLSAGALYVIVTQVYLLVALVLRGVNVNLHFAESGIHPTWLLVGSFIFLILAGSGLLMLPVATPENAAELYYVDALFTATSATCVTGLITRDTAGDWTVFGQAVILTMIQLGGLGIMLFGTMLAIMVGRELSLKGSETIGQMLATDRVGDLGRVVKFVVLLTFVLEIIGAVMLYPMFAAIPGEGGVPISTPKAIWHSVFHSVSSFCNAGFALFRNNMMQGVREEWAAPLRSNWQIMGVMAPLIVLGGLGFPVLRDCAGYAKKFFRRLAHPFSRPVNSPRPRLSLHSKIVLVISVLLIILGASVLLLLEPAPTDPNRKDRHTISDSDVRAEGDWQDMPAGQKMREAVFQSITARTAGFNTIDVNELSNAGKLWICGLMTIGGSPAGTAGGMKTVTFALLVLTAYCVLRRRRGLEVFGRSIPAELLRKTVTVAFLYLSLVAAVTLLLCVAMRGQSFINLLFEACSACGTVGLSTGVTRSLNEFGKSVIICGMFLGRIGPLTLLLGLTSRARHVRYEYPTENVVIG